MDTDDMIPSLLPQDSPESSSLEDGTVQKSSAKILSPQKLTVIGLGASAGGLAALRTFFAAMPHDTSMTFVVVVHLSPEHESVLAELLQDYTLMPVMQVQTRVKMEPDHVYVIPPGKRLLVTDGYLDLAEFDMPRGRRLQIDTFFRSLAEQHGDGAAIVLSGTGSDGAVGIQSIKEEGGLILVQSPEEAEYDGMPKSAIATGLVDIVAPVAELALQLVAAKQTKLHLEVPTNPDDLSAVAQQTLTQLLTQLRMRTGHDFSGYKRATILRRIGRRMQLAQLYTLSAYLNRLRQDGEEVDALYRDLLIHVTEFFRDSVAWHYLAEEVIPQIFANKSGSDNIRIWTVGCATGEEAYGIAMLLLEQASLHEDPPHIQIFASDLGRLVLDFAREGAYPEAIAADVSEERLRRFFIRDNSHYRVRPEVRELVLFAPHNLLQDPPFSKLDLVICRNLLIYLQRPVQERVFDSFYYALRPEGFLFLGSAESTDGITEHFDTVNKVQHIYRRSQQYREMLVLPSLPIIPRDIREEFAADAFARPETIEIEQHRVILEELGLPSVLIDENQRVLHFSETAGRYLQHPAGKPTTDITRLVRPELQVGLRQAIHRAMNQGKAVRTEAIPVRFNGAAHPVMIMVRPTPQRGRLLLLFFEDEAFSEESHAPALAMTAVDERSDELQAELNHAQQRLQAMREEFETTVEELRAANEELQSTNEEYRSTLEEFETSKEELQSINEELQSVNQEMRGRVDEVTQANSDLQNLFAATEIATLFLDRELRVKRYTPRAADLFNLMPPDRGRPISHLRANLGYATLESDARQVLATLIPIEHEVRDEDDRWFLAGVRPYRTIDDKIDGVVITCVDITASKAAEQALRTSEERLAVELTAMRRLHESVNRLLVSPDLQAALDEVLAAATEITGAEKGNVQLYNSVSNALEIVAQQGFGKAFLEYFQIVRSTDDSACGKAMREKIRVIVEDVTTDPLFEQHRQIAKEEGFRSVQSTPLLSRDGRFLGMLSTHYPTVHRPSARDLRLLDLYARQAADFIERMSAETSLRESARRDAFRLLLANALRELTDPVTIQSEAARVLGDYLGASRVHYGEILDDGARLVIHSDYTNGVPSITGVYDLEPFETWPVTALRTGRKAVVADVASYPELEPAGQQALLARGIAAFVSTPLVKDGVWIGLLAVHQSQSRQWSPEEVTLMEETAEWTWAAVERAYIEAALRSSEEQMRLILESVQDYAIFTLDEIGQVTSWSEGARRLMGYTAEESIGQPVAIFYVPEEIQAGKPDQEMVTALASGRSEDESWRLRKDGSRFWGNEIMTPLRAEDGKLLGFTKISRDLSARRRAEERLETEVMERTSQVRSLVTQLTISEQEERRRISSILHDDLQQRLFSLIFQLSFLRDAAQQAKTESINELLSEINGSLQEAVQITRDLSVDLSPPVLHNEGLLEAVDWLAQQMKQRHGLKVQVESSGTLPTLNDDLRVLLFQTARELLFNVVKHTEVRDAIVKMAYIDGELQVEVSDKGQGFRLSEMAEGRNNMQGLFRIEQRLQLFGGHIQIESTPGLGTRVTLFSPI